MNRYGWKLIVAGVLFAGVAFVPRYFGCDWQAWGFAWGVCAGTALGNGIGLAIIERG